MVRIFINLFSLLMVLDVQRADDIMTWMTYLFGAGSRPIKNANSFERAASAILAILKINPLRLET